MKIVAIGGGHLGNHENEPYDMFEIDKEIVSLSAKAHPRLLFICFNLRSNYYYGFLKKIYANLGAQCERLGFEEFENKKTVDGKFKRADILYLCGGNTINYMNKIKKFGLDEYIEKFFQENKVIAGISAGAIICHKFGSSDARKYIDKTRYTKVKGLGFIDALFSPHHSQSNRKDDMPRILSKCKNLVGFGVDECAAIVFDNDNFYIVKSNNKSKVYKCFYQNNNFVEKEINGSGKLDELLEKCWQWI